jgi:hypothetical protein
MATFLIGPSCLFHDRLHRKVGFSSIAAHTRIEARRRRDKISARKLSASSEHVRMAAVRGVPAAAQQQQRPIIVIIWGDDIGQSNISAYSRGVMGYRTPTPSKAVRLVREPRLEPHHQRLLGQGRKADSPLHIDHNGSNPDIM